MARIRTIKPDFFKHEALFDAEKETGLPLRLAFVGLWCQADREGRFEWRPRQLGVDILPYDEIDFSRVLDALATRGFVVKYVSKNKVYGVIPSWRKHQVVNNRERESDIPAPTKSDLENKELPTRDERDADATPTREERVPHGALQEGKGRERNNINNPPCVPPLKKTLEQALEDAPFLKQTCIEAATQAFERRDYDAINFELVFDEGFASYWLNEAATKKKADWPRTFVNWCLKDREKPEFQIEPRAVTVGDAIMKRAWESERKHDGSSWSRFRRECGDGKRGEDMKRAFDMAIAQTEKVRELPSSKKTKAGSQEGKTPSQINVHDERDASCGPEKIQEGNPDENEKANGTNP